ncbi:MAG: ABC transporter substrate-binding protein [Oscillospiraceae bacterium]
MLKKLISSIAVTTLLAASLAGCSTPPATTPSSTVPSSEIEKVAKDVTLSFMLPQTHYKDFMKDLTSKFETENIGYKIDVQAIPDNQWTDLVKTKVNVNEAPDIIRMDKNLMLELGTDKFVEFTAADSWYGRAIESQMTSMMVDGKLYGMPLTSDSAVGLLYNKELFDKYSVAVPTTHEELLAACEVFKKNGIDPIYASDKDTWTTQIWLTAATPQVTTPETFEKLMKNELKWSEVPELEDAIAKMGEFRAKGYTNKDFLAATYDGAQLAMAEGKAAMCVSGQFAIGDILKKNPNAQIRLTALPYKKDVMGVIKGTGELSIFNSSKNVEDAKVFVEWMSKAENMNEYTKAWGEFPVYKDQVIELPEWQQDVNDKYIASGKTAIEMNSLLPGIDLAEFWNYQQEMLTGTIDAKTVLTKWDKSFAEQAKAKAMAGF